MKSQEEFLIEITQAWRDNMKTREDCVAMVEAYADEIRRECAEMAVDYIYAYTECEDAMALKTAIMGK
jgi:hypothetical protein